MGSLPQITQEREVGRTGGGVRGSLHFALSLFLTILRQGEDDI